MRKVAIYILYFYNIINNTFIQRLQLINYPHVSVLVVCNASLDTFLTFSLAAEDSLLGKEAGVEGAEGGEDDLDFEGCLDGRSPFPEI